MRNLNLLIMKKAIVILSVVLLVSCEKHGMRDDDDDDDMKKCESVTNETVPTQVQTAFNTKYPQNTPEKWFNKDGKGFTALFTQNGSKMLSQFDNDGTFKTENIAPSNSTPPSNNQEHQGNCNKRQNKPHGLFGFRHRKHHHENSEKDNDEKETECQVELED